MEIHMKKLTIAIDLDGTICTEEKTFDKSLAEPLSGAIETIQNLYKQGHTLIIWTARGWDQFRVTENWLKKHSIPYDALLMGKPIVDIWIDDRAIKFEGWEILDI